MKPLTPEEVAKGLELLAETDAVSEALTPILLIASSNIKALVEQNNKLLKGVKAVEDLINDSYGVAGLHLNGEVAPWEDLLECGRYESWLIDLSTARGELI